MVDSLLQALNRLKNEQKDLFPKDLELWTYYDTDLHSCILAGEHLFIGGSNYISALDIETGEQIWRSEVKGNVKSLAFAAGRLLASTDKGSVLCFERGELNNVNHTGLEIQKNPYIGNYDMEIYRKAAAEIINATKVQKGWCLVLDAGEGCLAWEMARNTDLNFICLEKDPVKVKIAREKLSKAGLYGSRISFASWDVSELPDYFANLVISEGMALSGKVPETEWKEIHRILRPFGGIACLGEELTDPVMGENLRNWFGDISQPQEDELTITGKNGVWVKYIRGALQNAGTWTHLYADPQNRGISHDEELVRGPLGILWFGEPDERGMVDRHGRPMGPVSGFGRLFIQGEEKVMAYDAYNGTFLWEKKIPGSTRIRVDVDAGNLTLDETGLYVAARDKCYHLDPVTGETRNTYIVPSSSDSTLRRWGYIAKVGNILLGTASTPLNDYALFWETWVDEENQRWKTDSEVPAYLRNMAFHEHRWWFQCRGDRIENEQDVRTFGDVIKFYKEKYPVPNDLARRSMHHQFKLFEPMGDYPPWDPLIDLNQAVGTYLETVAADALFAYDTESGKLKWIYKGELIPNIAVVVTDGSVTFMEKALSGEDTEGAVKERNNMIIQGAYEEGPEKDIHSDEADVRHIVSLDIESGITKWEKHLDITGCGGEKAGLAFNLGKVVIFGHFNIKDLGRYYDAGRLAWRRITVLNNINGEVLWSKPLNYSHRPPIIEGKIFAEPYMVDIQTGDKITRTHPVTGEETPFLLDRTGKNCSPIQGSKHMIFFRRADIEMYNLEKDGGLIRMGAMRPSCWINMITANGLALFPEGASGCTCPYPVRTSLAMKQKSNDRREPWSVFTANQATIPVKHLSLNFGAPGDLREGSVLWIGYPRPIGYKNQLSIDLDEQIDNGGGIYGTDYRFSNVGGTDKQWLFANGIKGMNRINLRLNQDKKEKYLIRMGFASLKGDKVGQRVFDIMINGQLLVRNFDPCREANGENASVIKDFRGIWIKGRADLQLISRMDNIIEQNMPLINFLEIINEKQSNAVDVYKKENSTAEIELVKR